MEKGVKLVTSEVVSVGFLALAEIGYAYPYLNAIYTSLFL
jgi:hypothetical protein